MISATPTTFLVLSPVWNAREWVGKCVDSVAKQSYRDVRHVWVDDASTDGTRELLKAMVPGENLLLNRHRAFPSYNVWSVLANHVDGDCLVGLLDGDDWLIDDTAVEQMVAAHERCDVVWSTHLVVERGVGGTPVYRAETGNLLHARTGRVRGIDWRPTHFFSFRLRNFLKIDPADFKTDDGRWFAAMYDMALSVPLIEMAGWSRCAYIPRSLYAYNRMRPDSDDKVRRDLQKKLADVIRHRKTYSATQGEWR